MAHEDLEVLRSYYRALAEGRFTDIGALFDPDVEYARASPAGEAAGLTGTWRGRTAMWAGVQEFVQAFDRVRVEAERFVEVGDQVLVLTRFQAIARSSGLPVEKDTADVMTVRGGKIVRYYSYWDRPDALRAVGLPDSG